MKQKSVYQDGSINTMAIVILLSSLMIGFSLYLTQHYFDIKFPTGLEGKSLCNLNSFFNCDKTTLSPISNIFTVPISLFGVLVGMLTLLGLVFKNEDYERTIYFTLIANFVGCVVLFFYSLIVLKGLCPFCTLYYIASGLTLFLFYKKSADYKPAPAFLISVGLVFVLASVLMRSNISKKEVAQSAVASDLIKQYYSLADLGAPQNRSEFIISNHPDAPIKIQVFSDFECPACKALSEQMPKIMAKYENKIDIQYFYYPLDNSCNAAMERPLHQYACKAAYAATCMNPTEFAKTHDDIFMNQDKFESGFVDEYIKKNKLETCVADPKTKEKVVASIQAANPFNIKSTPTYLINGVKIEGVLPLDQLYSILDEIVKRNGKR